jgi:hypothetical protein
MAENNKMADVAALFGKKLGEEFIIVTENREKHKAYFTKQGLRVRGMYRGFWESTLFSLITGQAVIVDD